MDSLARILRNLPLFIAFSLWVVTNSLYNLNTFYTSITTLSLAKNHSKFDSLEKTQRKQKSFLQNITNTFVRFMEPMSTARRPCFVEEDDGLASLADMEAGISGSNHQNQHHNHPFFSRTLCYSASYNNRKGSFRNVSVSSPRSGRFYDARFEEHQPHFLEACFLCKKPLGDNRDIFMYRLAFFFPFSFFSLCFWGFQFTKSVLFCFQ